MLPTKKTAPKTDLTDFTILVHGKQKYGKSTFCSMAPDALFLATEPGLNSLETYQVPITSWDDLLAAAGEIAQGNHSFRTIVIDTIDLAYRMCADHVCRRAKVEHESDLTFGKGFALVNNEFYRVLTKLGHLPYGLVLISHSQDREVETRTGKVVRTIPTLPDKARKIVLGMVDMILYVDLEPVAGPEGRPETRRVIRTKPSLTYEAGDRTGRLPEVLDLDFAKFVEAFEAGAPRTAPPAPPSAPPSAKTATERAAR